MFTSGLKESQWTEEDGRTVQVDFYEDDDIDDEDDDIDDVMKEGRLLIGQRGVSNSMLYPAILSSSLSSK